MVSKRRTSNGDLLVTRPPGGRDKPLTNGKGDQRSGREGEKHDQTPQGKGNAKWVSRRFLKKVRLNPLLR